MSVYSNIVNVNNVNYSINPSNDGGNTLYIYTGASSKTITLPDLSTYGDGLYYTFYNNSGNVLITFSIIPTAGQNIITGNISLSVNANITLVSFQSNWYVI